MGSQSSFIIIDLGHMGLLPEDEAPRAQVVTVLRRTGKASHLSRCTPLPFSAPAFTILHTLA